MEWGFPFSTPTHLGLGRCFSGWVKILNREPKADVITNGIISPFFCTLLLINIIFLESLAASIRINNNIKGVEVGGQEHKLLHYADDILAVMTDPLTSLPHLMDTIQLCLHN